jgi:thioredoxin reductase
VDGSYDVVVVGGGAAGLSGALALVRARRSVLVVDAGQPRNLPAGHVHNYLTQDATTPTDLLAAGRGEVIGYGGRVIDGRVTAVARRRDGFLVTVDDRREVTARRLLVTTGLVDELPDVPGIAQRWGRDVMHCPHCNGWEVSDRRVGVLATEAMSAHRAAVWRQWSPHVVLLLNGLPKPAGEQAEWLAALGIAVVDGPVAEVIVAGDAVTGVRLASGDVVELDAVVITPRYVARAGVLAALGIEPIDVQVGGQVVGRQVSADPLGAPVGPGVWVAGNLADLRGHLITAAASGLNAAVAINADLVAEDTRVAVEAYRSRSGTAADAALPERGPL